MEKKNFTFGEATKLLEEGNAVRRKGWNGKNQFIYYVPASRYKAMTDIAKKIMDKDGYVNYAAYLAIKTEKGVVAIWTPVLADILADDWEIVSFTE